jgi:hypothetical protein
VQFGRAHLPARAGDAEAPVNLRPRSIFPDRLESTGWLSCAAMVIDSTLLIAAILIGIVAILIFFPFEKL